MSQQEPTTPGDAETSASPAVCEQNCREAVIACCEARYSQRAANELREDAATRSYSQHLKDMEVYAGPFSAYCIMRSTDRQERFIADLKDLTKAQNVLVDESLKAARESTDASKTYAKVAIGLAFSSLVALVVVSCVSIRSSSRWQGQQIPLLQRIVHNTRGTEITAHTFRVLRVVDGDTFKITYDGEPTSVRFHGINAPERSDPNGPAATAALRKMIGGKRVH